MTARQKKLCLLLCLCLFFIPAHAFAAAREFVVTGLFDGDTLRLADGRRLRLAGIDCPELGHGAGPDQYYGREALALSRGLVKGAGVRLEHVGADHYGRLVAEVLLPDGRSLNLLLVREGAAFAYWHKGMDSAFFEKLLAAQRNAMAERRGAWAFVLDMASARASYVGNMASRRFFSSGCKGGAQTGAARRIVFASLEDAFAAGHAPARHCATWPLVKR